MPYNNALREFYTELATGKEDQQLVYYIEDAADKSSWIYTEERYETADKPYFEEGASIRNISFGWKNWYIGDYDNEKGENVYLQDGITIKFDFDTACDSEGIELYRIRIRNKETGEYVYFHERVPSKHSLRDYTYCSSRYYTAQVYDWPPFESMPIQKTDLIEGKTYVIEVYAIDTFHVESDTPITAEFVYGA